jgi:hypothetical protein
LNGFRKKIKLSGSSFFDLARRELTEREREREGETLERM